MAKTRHRPPLTLQNLAREPLEEGMATTGQGVELSAAAQVRHLKLEGDPPSLIAAKMNLPLGIVHWYLSESFNATLTGGGREPWKKF